MLYTSKKRHPNITFHKQDICECAIPNKYDFITAWDSIWHLPLAQHKPVLTKLVSSLNKDGVLIFTFGNTNEAGELIDDYMGPEVYYSTLGTNGFIGLLLELNCTIKHLECNQKHTHLIVQKL